MIPKMALHEMLKTTHTICIEMASINLYVVFWALDPAEKIDPAALAMVQGPQKRVFDPKQ